MNLSFIFLYKVVFFLLVVFFLHWFFCVGCVFKKILLVALHTLCVLLALALLFMLVPFPSHIGVALPMLVLIPSHWFALLALLLFPSCWCCFFHVGAQVGVISFVFVLPFPHWRCFSFCVGLATLPTCYCCFLCIAIVTFLSLVLFFSHWCCNSF